MAAPSNQTYFGDVVSRIFRRHGFSQSKFAKEAAEQGVSYNANGAKSKRYAQNGISQWMSGKISAPKEFPSDLRKIVPLEPDEWLELAVAFAYGQDMSREDFEDLEEFWEFYRTVLASEAEERAESEAREK